MTDIVDPEGNETRAIHEPVDFSGKDVLEASSAVTEAMHVRPLAIRAMAEFGVDFSAEGTQEHQLEIDREVRDAFRDRIERELLPNAAAI